MNLGYVEKGWVAGRKDAFHVPAVLATTDDVLEAGDNVVFFGDPSRVVVEESAKRGRHGVIDPFAKEVGPGKLFWVILDPSIVSDMTHQFDVSIGTPKVEKLSTKPDPIEEKEEDWGSDYDDGCGRGCG